MNEFLSNQKGFILPLTVIVLFLLASFTLFQIRQYVIERDFYFEYSEAFTNERLLQLAIVDVAKKIDQSTERIDLSGILYYDKGEVSYQIRSKEKCSYSILLTSKTKNNRLRQLNYTYSILRGECAQ